MLLRKKKQHIVISVKRLQNIEELAEFVAESTFPNSRIEPEQITDQLGITHNYGHYGDAFDGLLEYCDGDFHIFGNLERVYYPEHPRARFTFSHELGHYFIDEHRNALAGGVGPHASFTDYQSNNPAELEADSFAAALLMPEKRFFSAVRPRRPSVQSIRELVEQFGTSYASTAIRYAKSNLHSVIVMRWTFEERKWCWSSKDMHQITGNKLYKFAEKIPVGSLTHSMLYGIQEMHSVKGSTLSAWCPFVMPGSKKDMIVSEETMSLGSYGVLTILYPA